MRIRTKRLIILGIILAGVLLPGGFALLFPDTGMTGLYIAWGIGTVLAVGAFIASIFILYCPPCGRTLDLRCWGSHCPYCGGALDETDGK